jgi:hypothetical protein
MQKLFIIISILFFISCAPSLKQKRIPEIMMIMEIDFTKYSEKGFLFTPNSYQGDYNSKGLITLTYYPDAELITTVKTMKNNVGEVSTYKESYWNTNSINSNTLLDSIYSICLEMGADAFTQLEILNSPPIHHASLTTNPVSISGKIINGYAIKRLGAFK